MRWQKVPLHSAIIFTGEAWGSTVFVTPALIFSFKTVLKIRFKPVELNDVNAGSASNQPVSFIIDKKILV